MKNTPTVILLVVVVVFGLFSFWQTMAIRALRGEVNAMQSVRSSASDALDLQARCSKQAPETVRHFGWKAGDGIHFLTHTNHFNDQLNRCILKARISDPVAGMEGRGHYFRLFVVDAFEFTTYGEYVELVDLGEPGGSFTGWVKTCKVKLPKGGDKSCKSQAEFEQLVAAYLEG